MATERPTEPLAAAVEALTGQTVAGWSRAHGGYTNAERWLATLAGGERVFVKAAVDGPTKRWLEAEIASYRAIEGEFMARPVAHGAADDMPVLLLEDLSEAHWPPPWDASRIERTLEMLGRIAATPPPPHAPPLESRRSMYSGWSRVAADPEPFLGLEVATAGWLERALPELLRAEAASVLNGEALVHSDVRSDNICFAGDRTLIVDWNLPARGNPEKDLSFWLPSLRFEGGPRPDEVAAVDPTSTVVVAGYFAGQAGLPNIPHAPRVRRVQFEQLAVALPWAARALDLPPPDGPRWQREGLSRFL